MSFVIAHGIGGVRDLPVPTWLFLYGGGVVVVVSFVALGALWTRPRLEQAADGRPLPKGLQRVLLAPALRILLGALGVFLFAVVSIAAVVGPPSPADNVAPTFVWVIFWVGLVPVVIVFGNVWAVLSPFRAIADAVAWLAAKARVEWEPVPYPEELGRWPAAALLYCFVALELAYWDPADPRVLALAAYLYALVTWAGMLVFGRRAWLENGEAFHSYFGLLGRIAPFAVVDRGRRREVVVRPPLSGLATGDARPGTLTFVAVMLGSVAFDSIGRTTFWLDFQARLGWGVTARAALNAVGLAATIGLVALAFLAAVWAAGAFAPRRTGLVAAFVTSLVPIALVYAVAHYFSLVIGQGKYLITFASDPFGRGWDLFGTIDFQPNLTPLSPNAIWYVQVGALIVGHVAGLMLAHDRAVALFPSSGAATRSQLPMLALMVLYTVGGLWLLSSG